MYYKLLVAFNSQSMKIKGLVLLLFTLFVYSAVAQEVPKIRGYQGIVEVGGGLNIRENKGGYFKADFINGYKFNHSFSIGLGLGARYVITDHPWYNPQPEGKGGFPMLSLFVNFRANLGYHKFEEVFPYVQTQLGVTVPYSGFINQSIGLGFKKLPLTIGLYVELLGLYSEIDIAMTPQRPAVPFLVGLNFGVPFSVFKN